VVLAATKVDESVSSYLSLSFTLYVCVQEALTAGLNYCTSTIRLPAISLVLSLYHYLSLCTCLSVSVCVWSQSMYIGLNAIRRRDGTWVERAQQATSFPHSRFQVLPDSFSAPSNVSVAFSPNLLSVHLFT